MPKNILITSAGRRVSLVKAFQQSLLSSLHQAEVYTSDLNPSLSPACQFSQKKFYLPHVNEGHYLNELLSLCKAEGIALVIPTLDTELMVFAKAKAVFAKEGINLLVSDESFITRCRDKWQTHLLFQKYGIAIPLQYDRRNIKFPAFAKPFDGSMSKDIWILPSAAHLAPALLQDERLMFMEYLDPLEYEEYTVDAYYDNWHNLKCMVPRLRMEIRGGEISKGITKRGYLYEYLFRKLNYMEGARGCITMQFFNHRSQKRILGIEINPRFGGGYPLSYASGADFPTFLIEEYLKQNEVAIFDNWKANQLMLRYDAEVFAIGHVD